MALFNVAPTKFWSPISVSTNSFTAEASRPSFVNKRNKELFIPTMAEIMESSKHQNLRLQLQTLGPFFRISARSLETGQELGRADGFIRLWFGGRILHLDSIRLKRETVSLQRSIFGTGLYVGAVAVRHGYDCGCQRTELLAINDTDLYHSKLVRFYKRMGFKAVHEVTGSSIGDLSHMLVWGGKGTRMDADIQELLLKWGSRFKARKLVSVVGFSRRGGSKCLSGLNSDSRLQDIIHSAQDLPIRSLFLFPQIKQLFRTMFCANILVREKLSNNGRCPDTSRTSAGKTSWTCEEFTIRFYPNQ